MLQYEEIKQLAYEYRKVRLENADQQRLLQSIRQGQPQCSECLQRLTHTIGQRLVQWGRQLQGQPYTNPLNTTASILIGK